MKIKTLLVIGFLTCLINSTQGYQLRGTVSDSYGRPIPDVSIQLENSTYGVISNLKGQYYLELKDGDYQIIFHKLGYEPKAFDITIEGEHIDKHVVLKEAFIELQEVDINAEAEDPAYGIIRSAISVRKQFYRQLEHYSCSAYSKASMEREKEIQKVDSVNFEVKTEIDKKQMEFTESISTIYFKAPGTYKEVKHAHQDHTKKQRLSFGNSVELGVTLGPDIDEYAPPQQAENQLLFYTSVTDGDFNFYQNLVDLPKLFDRPFISPLSTSAFLTYNFKLITSFREDDRLIYKIEVQPKRKAGPVFSGYIYITDEIWSIKALELSIPSNALNIYQSFKLLINYTQVDGKYWLPEREEFYYHLKLQGNKVMGNSLVMYSKYDLTSEPPRKIFDNALSIVEDSAEGKGVEFWTSKRPITLRTHEKQFIKKQDSIRNYYASDAYKFKADSSYNEIGIMNFLFLGVGHRNSIKGNEYRFDPLIMQPRPFAVGGYRHALGGNYIKTFENKTALRTRAEVNYGFLNKDIRGRGSLGYLYNPKKFAEISVGGGSTYQMINTYESLAATFSRSNYVLAEHITVGYRRELVNGLAVKTSLEYAVQKSLDGYNLAGWSSQLFGDLNEPRAFEGYTKMVWETRFTIRFKQKYYMKPNQKVILGSTYPKLQIFHKLGIPNVLGSEVNFQSVEARLFDDFNIGLAGVSKYDIRIGTFLNRKAKRFIDDKLFRTADNYFYSNPLQSFQLLESRINTDRPFLQAHYRHNFKGFITNKIPGVNKLRLSTAAGASALAIERNNFFHFESYAGLERPFRVGKQLFKIGVYYVAANSTHSTTTGRVKFGIDFYNSFTNRWSY